MKKVLVFIAIITISISANAQSKSNRIPNFRVNNFRINYDVAVPLGKMSSEFINQMSWRGVSIENRWGIKPKISIGYLLGWQVFAQRFDNYTQELNNGNAAINGNQFRTINTFPIQGTVHYTIVEDADIMPWVGLGIGLAHSNQVMQVGFFEDQRTITSFSLTPQAGIDLPINRVTSLSVSTRYNFFLHSSQPFNYSFMVFSVGIKNRYF
jgi:outer membrane protein W